MSSARISGDAGSDAALATSEFTVLHVEAVFHELAPAQAESIAAELIARAHELANMVENECDVDVNVRRKPSGTDSLDSV